MKLSELKNFREIQEEIISRPIRCNHCGSEIASPQDKAGHRDWNDVKVICAWGRCINYLCHSCNRIWVSFGALFCTCDYLGVRGHGTVAEQPKPSVAIKGYKKNLTPKGKYERERVRIFREGKYADL